MFSKKRRSNLLRKVVAPFVLSSIIFSCASQITNADTYTWKVKQNYTYSDDIKADSEFKVEDIKKGSFMYKSWDEWDKKDFVKCYICNKEFDLSNNIDVNQMKNHSHICDLELKYNDNKDDNCLTISGKGELNRIVFSDCRLKEKRTTLRKEVKKIIVGTEVKTVADFTFSVMYKLNSIDISHVSNLGSQLFGYCKGLRKVIFKEDVEIANFNGMFTNCVNLETVTLPKSVKNIKGGFDYMFFNCENLTKINNFPIVPKEFEKLMCTFKDCYSLPYMKIEIEEGGKLCLKDTFGGCTNLVSVDIDDKKISYVDTGCFINCLSFVKPERLTKLTYKNWNNRKVGNL